jgi:hypothetical protein
MVLVPMLVEVTTKTWTSVLEKGTALNKGIASSSMSIESQVVAEVSEEETKEEAVLWMEALYESWSPTAAWAARDRALQTQKRESLIVRDVASLGRR